MENVFEEMVANIYLAQNHVQIIFMMWVTRMVASLLKSMTILNGMTYVRMSLAPKKLAT